MQSAHPRNRVVDRAELQIFIQVDPRGDACAALVLGGPRLEFRWRAACARSADEVVTITPHEPQRLIAERPHELILGHMFFAAGQNSCVPLKASDISVTIFLGKMSCAGTFASTAVEICNILKKEVILRRPPDPSVAETSRNQRF